MMQDTKSELKSLLDSLFHSDKELGQNSGMASGSLVILSIHGCIMMLILVEGHRTHVSTITLSISFILFQWWS